MTREVRLLAGAFAVVGLVAANGVALAFAPSNDTGQTPGSPSERTKQHKDYSGKALLGDNIKKNGPHRLLDHGKYRASVTVWNGKITGMSVRHADQGSVSVTKYETTTNMTGGATNSVRVASYDLVQSRHVRTTWIVYGYDDEWGDEYLYWFPYEMISDGITGAIDSDPAY